MALRKYRMETRHWGACSVLYAVPRAGDSVLANQMNGKVFFVAFLCCIRDIIKYLCAHNLPEPHKPSTSYTPPTTHIPQPPTPHNHPHHSTTHIPPTTHHPKSHSFQNYTHSKITHTHPTAHTHQPHTLTTHTLQPHTYPPTTHISQSPTPDVSPSCTNEYTGTK